MCFIAPDGQDALINTDHIAIIRMVRTGAGGKIIARVIDSACDGGGKDVILGVYSSEDDVCSAYDNLVDDIEEERTVVWVAPD